MILAAAPANDSCRGFHIWCPSVKQSEICFYVTVIGCDMGVACSSVHGSLFGCTGD